MNKVVFMGRLTKDPEVRYSQAAEPVAIAKYTLAVNRKFKRENEPDVDFINCVVFGKGGEFAEKYLKKGMMIAVSGRLQIRSYDDQNGQKHWITEVIVEDQDFAESRSAFESRMASSGEGQASTYQARTPAPNAAKPAQPEGFYAISESIDDEDLPF